MTVLLDVPLSGKYLQQGGVTELVVTIKDVNTGLPLQIQTATDLTIFIGYPDLTFEKVTAELYTDGSDGAISYVTENDVPVSADLVQVGLYHLQGQVSIGGAVALSDETDFYVLPNVFPLVLLPQYPAFILTDSALTRWAITVLPTGNLFTGPLASGPAGAYDVEPFYMQSSDGSFWVVTILPAGNLDIQPYNLVPTVFLTTLLLTDSNDRAWIMTITIDGHLDTK